MRAWLLLLVVLATFKPIVQVASTEETASVKFVKAITPQKKEFFNIITNNTEIDFQLKATIPPKGTKTTTEMTTATTSPKSTSNSIKQSDISSPALTSLSSSSIASLSSSTASASASTSKSNDDDLIIEEPATSSNKELIKEKPTLDPKILVEIEKSFLLNAGMSRRPNIDRSKIFIPETIKKLYEKINNQEVISLNIPRPGLLTKTANTVTSFTHQESKIDHRFPHHHRFRLYFDIKTIPENEKLKAAELQLTRDKIDHEILKPEHAKRTVYQVLVYDITRVGIRGKREPSYLLLDNKAVRLNSTEMISLDVQPAVQRWLNSPKKNYGLLIEVRTPRSLKPAPHHHVRLRRSLDEPHEKWKHKQPVLLTYTDDGRHKQRSKRAERHQNRRSRRRKTNDDCRRHSLWVDFTDVGWSDWIVAPPGYDAYYCSGKCPKLLVEHHNTTNHAVIQTLVNDVNPAKVPLPCCVPTELESMSMLYLNDQNSVVLKNYQDMSVRGCGCR